MAEWKLVPVEPTPQMIHEAMVAANRDNFRDWARASYQAMLAAAPQAPSGQQAERPAPAGQAVVIRALTMARHALVNLRINKSAESLALANALDEALAGQQSERPAPAGQAVGEVNSDGGVEWFDKSPGDWEPGTKLYLASQAERTAGRKG